MGHAADPAAKVTKEEKTPLLMKSSLRSSAGTTDAAPQTAVSEATEKVEKANLMEVAKEEKEVSKHQQEDSQGMMVASAKEIPGYPGHLDAQNVEKAEVNKKEYNK